MIKNMFGILGSNYIQTVNNISLEYNAVDVAKFIKEEIIEFILRDTRLDV